MSSLPKSRHTKIVIVIKQLDLCKLTTNATKRKRIEDNTRRDDEAPIKTIELYQ